MRRDRRKMIEIICAKTKLYLAKITSLANGSKSSIFRLGLFSKQSEARHLLRVVQFSFQNSLSEFGKYGEILFSNKNYRNRIKMSAATQSYVIWREKPNSDFSNQTFAGSLLNLNNNNNTGWRHKKEALCCCCSVCLTADKDSWEKGRHSKFQFSIFV